MCSFPALVHRFSPSPATCLFNKTTLYRRHLLRPCHNDLESMANQLTPLQTALGDLVERQWGQSLDALVEQSKTKFVGNDAHLLSAWGFITLGQLMPSNNRNATALNLLKDAIKSVRVCNAADELRTTLAEDRFRPYLLQSKTNDKQWILAVPRLPYVDFSSCRRLVDKGGVTEQGNILLTQKEVSSWFALSLMYIVLCVCVKCLHHAFLVLHCTNIRHASLRDVQGVTRCDCVPTQ